MRGIVLAVLVTMGGAPLIGLEWVIGFRIGSLPLAGDLFTSFLKRRMSLPPSSQASGLDQVPEALLPLFACRNLLFLTTAGLGVATALFLIGDVLASRVLYTLRLRDRPY
jgi:CDP-2,3-bis-(O-geranylgeranyl)-sn-glycerol synthase